MILQAIRRFAVAFPLALGLAAGGCGEAARKEVLRDAAPLPSGKYLVVNVAAGPDAESYPVTELDQAPPDLLTDDSYKTTRIVLRRIPAGTFLMGSPKSELGHFPDEAQHKVTLTRDFYIGVFQVTQAQYANVTGADPSYYKGALRPVDRVNWHEARGGSWPGKPPGAGQPASGSFVARLRARTGLAFGLPTEAQWEYACRAEKPTSLNSGKNITVARGACPNMNEVGRYRFNGGTASHHAVVGSYQPNAWGLYDMHGNVLEWCLDWYGAYPSGPATDPAGPTSGGDRVARGGSWYNSPMGCRAAFRIRNIPSDRRLKGFRLVCQIQE